MTGAEAILRILERLQEPPEKRRELAVVPAPEKQAGGSK